MSGAEFHHASARCGRARDGRTASDCAVPRRPLAPCHGPRCRTIRMRGAEPPQTTHAISRCSQSPSRRRRALAARDARPARAVGDVPRRGAARPADACWSASRRARSSRRSRPPTTGAAPRARCRCAGCTCRCATSAWPATSNSFATASSRLRRASRRGDVTLLHCAAGIGRTGTAAACLLKRLGLPREQALQLVRAAGSSPESAVQSGLVDIF